MIKEKINTTDLKKSAGEFVNSARLRGDCYIISQRGKEGAALVPLHVLESWENSRQNLVQYMDEVALNSDLSEEEANDLAEEAILEVRKARLPE